MSIYSEISKRIGWEGHCAIPSVETAGELLCSVAGMHCREAFEMAFKIHRFAPLPGTEGELEAMNIIHEAYVKGARHFRSV